MSCAKVQHLNVPRSKFEKCTMYRSLTLNAVDNVKRSNPESTDAGYVPPARKKDCKHIKNRMNCTKNKNPSFSYPDLTTKLWRLPEMCSTPSSEMYQRCILYEAFVLQLYWSNRKPIPPRFCIYLPSLNPSPPVHLCRHALFLLPLQSITTIMVQNHTRSRNAFYFCVTIYLGLNQRNIAILDLTNKIYKKGAQ